MKTSIRIIVTFVSVFASYYLIYWLPFAFIPKAQNIPAIPIVISLLLAIGIGVFIWKKTATISNGLATYILMGGIIIGSIGFILGFVGPMILSPSSNQGPLLGILITGPLGFLIGLIGGGIYWWINVKNRKNLKADQQKTISNSTNAIG